MWFREDTMDGLPCGERQSGAYSGNLQDFFSRENI
jgi:hypothetical protein